MTSNVERSTPSPGRPGSIPDDETLVGRCQDAGCYQGRAIARGQRGNRPFYPLRGFIIDSMSVSERSLIKVSSLLDNHPLDKVKKMGLLKCGCIITFKELLTKKYSASIQY